MFRGSRAGCAERPLLGVDRPAVDGVERPALGWLLGLLLVSGRDGVAEGRDDGLGRVVEGLLLGLVLGRLEG
tara:strand:- start:32 stop:247 length:216 start_codon:yes stop_codon:yes gene_type:complete